MWSVNGSFRSTRNLYYTIRKFMKNPKLIDSYNVSQVKRHIPTTKVIVDCVDAEVNGNMRVFYGYEEYSDHDYPNFIAKESSGLTETDQKLLQESIESFVYSVSSWSPS